MSQPYLPNIPTMRFRLRSVRNRWSVAAFTLLLVASTLALTAFNTYKLRFYRKESLRLYSRAQIEGAGPQIRLREEVIVFNPGTTTVAVTGLHIQAWNDVNPHPPANQGVNHFGGQVSNSVPTFVLKPGDTSQPLNFDVVMDGPKYYRAAAPIVESSDRILTLQFVVMTVSIDRRMRRTFNYPFMRLRLDASGAVSEVVEVGFGPELSPETPDDIHWDEKNKMLTPAHLK